MANEFVPTVKSPSKDNLYEEVMKPYEEGMNFFLNKEVSVDATNVAEENKETVAGLVIFAEIAGQFCRIPGKSHVVV